MIRVALKGLAGRKLRSVLTALAIVLGVAMVSGTFVLTDTINKGFNTIFTVSYQNTDAAITARTLFSSNQNGNTDTHGFPASVLGRVRALPGVAAAVGSIADQAELIGRNGKPIQIGGAPNLAFSVDSRPQFERFNPLTLVAGHWPHGGDEIAIDESVAKKKHYAVGDTIGVVARGPKQRFRIVGVAKFGAVQSIGGATLAIFDVPTAQRLFEKQGKLDAIRVAGKPNVTPTELVRQIEPVLPPTAQVRPGAEQAKEDAKDVNSFIGVLQKALLAFAGVALFVGAFVIANTLSITVAQRAREFATLRTLGATRRQVRRSVAIEGLVLGLAASTVGLFAGLGLAKLLDWLFGVFGLDLPQSGTVFALRTVIVSLLLGTIVTRIATFFPARRATRVPPIAAVREGAVLPPSRLERFGPLVSIAVIAVAVLLLVYGSFANHLPTGRRLGALGGGVLLLFVGVALFAKQLVRPLAAVLGAPGARFGGVAGRLARENATRNPARTASTAAALMIGLALVTFVAVFAQGLRTPFEDAVNELFVGDYALTATNNFTPFPTRATEALRGVPGVQAVSGIRAGDGRAFGSIIQVSAVEPNVSEVIDVKWQSGSPDVPAELGANGAFTDDKYATKHHLVVGSPLQLETPSGKTLDLRIKGIFKPPKGGSPYGKVTISTAAFDRSYPQPTDIYAFVKTKGGVTPANTTALKAAVAAKFPSTKIATRSEFKRNQERPLNQLLNLLFVLLGLSVIISLFGIVNTLVLSVYERTRELGMLRAVGTTRLQVAAMILGEGVVTALIGAALGIGVGFFLAALVTHALASEGIVFAVPWGQVAIFVVAAVIVGIVAALLPARRAARIDVLRAIAYE
jgi:putative ABC transport system permease protein